MHDVVIVVIRSFVYNYRYMKQEAGYANNADKQFIKHMTRVLSVSRELQLGTSVMSTRNCDRFAHINRAFVGASVA